MTKPWKKSFGRRRLRVSPQGATGQQFELVLLEVGIRTVAQFLSATSTTRDRLLLTARTGLTAREIRELVSVVEFQQLTGFNPYIVDRLRSAGVQSLQDLARSDPEELTGELLEGSPQWNVSPRDLTTLISIWIAEARELHSVLN